MDTKATMLIKALGGPTAVARRFQIRAPSVCGWRATGIPSARLQTLIAWAVIDDRIASAMTDAGYDVADLRKSAGLATVESNAA